jgi:membrane protease YdiL (CAAX protease family)
MKRLAKHRPLVAFYLIAFAISWPCWALMYVAQRGAGSPGIPELDSALTGDSGGLLVTAGTYLFSTLGALGPLLSLALLGRLSGGEFRLATVMSRIRYRGAGRRWLPAAALALPAITLAGGLLSFVAGREAGLRLIKPGPDELGIAVLPVMAIHFATSLATSPLFEEPGWRGFALGRLQRRFGREVGSAVVGALWWLWHQPMNLTFGSQPTLYGFLSMVSFSFLIDSFFNLSGGNLLAAMLAHGSANTVMVFLYEGHENPFTLILQVALVALLRYREATRATYAEEG